MSVTLKDEKLLDSWGIVIEGAAGKHAHLLNGILVELKAGELPGVAWSTIEANPGMIKGLFGKKRDFLRITCEALKDYRMYVGSRDYGRHLDFSWFLTVEPGFFKGALSRVLTEGASSSAISFNLDLFDQQDLRAYVTAVHHCCVRRAVERFVGELGQSTADFDWKSKGFLQVW